MYMFSTILLVVGTITLWIVYQVEIWYKLGNATQKLIQIADAECFKLSGINLALRSMEKYY